MNIAPSIRSKDPWDDKSFVGIQIHFEDDESISPLLTRAKSSVSFGDDVCSSLPHLTQGVPTGQRKSLRRTSLSRSLRRYTTSFVGFIPILWKLSAAEKEYKNLVAKRIPGPLYELKSVMDDLLDHSQDQSFSESSRNYAMKLLRQSFLSLAKQIFVGFVQARFVEALYDICKPNLSPSVRNSLFLDFYFMLAAGASMGFKSSMLEREDSRTIMRIYKKPVDLSLRLAAASYLCLASLTHENDVISPVTEDERQDLTISLLETMAPTVPLTARSIAADLLWTLESSPGNDFLSNRERRMIALMIFEMANPELSTEEILPALERIWRFSCLPDWQSVFQELSGHKLRTGRVLSSLTSSEHSYTIRKKAFEISYLFINNPLWAQIFDEVETQYMTIDFIQFCLSEDSQVKQTTVHADMGDLAIAFNGSKTAHAYHEGSFTRYSINLRREYSKTSQVFGPCMLSLDVTPSVIFENLRLFVLPGETLLNSKNLEDAFSRAREAANLHQMRDVAIPVLHALLVVRHWMSSIRLPENPLTRQSTH